MHTFLLLRHFHPLTHLGSEEAPYKAKTYTSMNTQRLSLWFLLSVTRFSVSLASLSQGCSSHFVVYLLKFRTQALCLDFLETPLTQGLTSGDYFSAQSKQLKIEHKTSLFEHALATGDVWPVVFLETDGLLLCGFHADDLPLLLPSPPFSALLPRKLSFIFYVDWLSYLFVSMPPSKSCPWGPHLC